MDQRIELPRRSRLEAAVDALLQKSAADTALADGPLLDRFVRHQDEPAFHALYHRHSPLVWRMCRRALDAASADDAFQAVWLVFARKAQTIRDGQALLGWLIRVCARVIGKARKQRSREAELSARSLAMNSERNKDSAQAPDRRTELSEIAQIVEAEVRGLPDECRIVFELSHLEGLGRSDTIRQLGLTALQYDRRVRRARDLLARRLTLRGITLSAALAVVAVSGEAGLAKPTTDLVRMTAELILAARTLPLAQVPASAAVLKLTSSVLTPGIRQWAPAMAAILLLAGGAFAATAALSSPQKALSSATARNVAPQQIVAERNFALMRDQVLPKVRSALQTTVLGNGELNTDRAEIHDHIVYADFTAHHRVGDIHPFQSHFQMTYDTMCQRLTLKLDYFGTDRWDDIDLARPIVLGKNPTSEKEAVYYPGQLRDIIAAFEELPFAEEIAAFKTGRWNQQGNPNGRRCIPGSVQTCHGNHRALFLRTGDHSLWVCDLRDPDFRWTCIGGCPGDQLTVNDNWLICNYRDRIWVRPADAQVHPWRDVAAQSERVWSLVATNDVLYAQRYNGDLLARPIRDWSKPWVCVDNRRDAHLFSDGIRLFEQSAQRTVLNWRLAGLTPGKIAPYESKAEAMFVGFAAGGKFWTVRDGPNPVPTELWSRPMSPDEQEWTIEAQAVKVRLGEPKVKLRLE